VISQGLSRWHPALIADGCPDRVEDRALDALALAWGDAYEISVVDGQWQAWREGSQVRAMSTRGAQAAVRGRAPGRLAGLQAHMLSDH